jgi:hypothetical protein
MLRNGGFMGLIREYVALTPCSFWCPSLQLYAVVNLVVVR